MKPVGLHRLHSHEAHPGGKREKGEEMRKEEEKGGRERRWSNKEENGGNPGLCSNLS